MSEVCEGELEAAHRILSEIPTDRKLQIVAVSQPQSLEPDFLDNISREGTIIYGKPMILTTEDLQLRPYVIYNYSVANIPQIQKTMLYRALSGYKITRRTRGRDYRSEKKGMLEMLEAKKLGKGVIMVPQRNCRAIEKLFVQHGTKFTRMKVWC